PGRGRRDYGLQPRYPGDDPRRQAAADPGCFAGRCEGRHADPELASRRPRQGRPDQLPDRSGELLQPRRLRHFCRLSREAPDGTELALMTTTQYAYKVKDASGKFVEGKVKAASEAAVAEKLKSMGYVA